MGSIDSTTENQVDAATDRTARIRTLMVLKGTAQVVFHRRSKRVDDRSGTQLQPIANGADIIVLFVSCSNVKTVGRIRFGRRVMVCISNGGDIVNHGGE